MSNHSVNKKGVVLVMALMTLLVVLILANIILAIILSQSRLTHHQVSRIRAYYAALAGINYTIERLRTNTPGWEPPASGSINRKTICPAASGCDVPNSGLPYTVIVTIWPEGSDPPTSAHLLAGVAPITATVDYTYTMP